MRVLRPHRPGLLVSLCVALVAGVLLQMHTAHSQGPAKVLKPTSGGELVLLPAGTFSMGDAKGRKDEAVHTVTIGALYMDRYLVTQEQYEKVMGFNPSKNKGKKNPVEQIRWFDAILFCNKASKLDGLTPCYDEKTGKCNFKATGYRLPTEGEWEYACRAGSKTRYSFGDDAAKLAEYAWFKNNAGGKSHPVGTKKPNAWKLYDMTGNVWQWCQDWYAADYYKKSPKADPIGPATGTTRVLRGGAWNAPADKCRAAYRFHEIPAYADACFGDDNYGFRRVRRGK